MNMVTESGPDAQPLREHGVWQEPHERTAS